ncbi:putative cobalt transporter subunit (CbtB) [Roseovarius litorisediminis]|uniref:Putative cobalt transporter subunit (CbtB) n=1 Tax=Roseovarius litorisediminis TaxID=1312363 RepID=A0A1Y5TDU7_9RHOB|nr:CbtB domain-containing protein [Roseovarius litorisediminis]SLN59732.1 putative cobalt transporter subunit (CbtB) [Roseovarius litorisediminis]
MTAQVKTAAKSTARSTVMPFLAAMVLGLGIITIAGHVQASALHDAAHDVRHATGFPCH